MPAQKRARVEEMAPSGGDGVVARWPGREREVALLLKLLGEVRPAQSTPLASHAVRPERAGTRSCARRGWRPSGVARAG